MKKKEQAFNTIFNQYLRTVYKQTAAFELKHTRGKSSLPFSDVKEHQINALLAVKHGTFAYKISDAGLTFKPFDGFSLHNVPAFIVIRYPKSWYAIDVDVFLKEKEISKRKSLTEIVAERISAFKG